ncbi:hypothetical protein SAMN02910447_03317 [Ruminococcus sp. YE71]|uniref:hypothetical protein n=1 Tax=unclassified Ruminococcus TaxID=2608920 RepID=UPI00088C2AD7|nr:MULTISPECIES: hypothetical protein [unclassified Ruminococcus]SDA31040.1 hypothetical protein SAMN02910446_03386 [Ruminococcus sp. YE78]SFW50918.1 hypothetical protein SAMN02910447_03317 [Ruminococcus sp. YE71]
MRVVNAGLFSYYVGWENSFSSVVTHLPIKLMDDLGLKAGDVLYGYHERSYYFLVPTKPDRDEVKKMTLTSTGKIRYYPKNNNEYLEIADKKPAAAFYRLFDGKKLVGVAVKLMYLKTVCSFCYSEVGLCSFGGKYICADCLNGMLNEFGKLKGNDK